MFVILVPLYLIGSAVMQLVNYWAPMGAGW